MKTAVIMRGLPGSGKSTVAGRLAPEQHICSTDKFCMVNGVYQWSADKQAARHDANFTLFRSLCEQGIEVVVCDNTNTRRKEFERYVVVAESLGYEVVVITVGNPESPTHIDRCCERNTHGVPRETIERMAARFER